jgi:hypothetical protein
MPGCAAVLRDRMAFVLDDTPDDRRPSAMIGRGVFA